MDLTDLMDDARGRADRQFVRDLLVHCVRADDVDRVLGAAGLEVTWIDRERGTFSWRRAA